MKVVSTEALTKLIQLIKSSFISVDDTEQTSEIETETPSEVTLATVATTGDYDDLINKPTAYHPDLLSFQWSDHLLNNVSWLRADTFSWQDGTVYEAAYEHLTDDITGITPTTETIGSNTITVYVASDGHKIVLEDQAQTVQDIYDETGVAWYFILDTTNQRFKLPRELPITDRVKGNSMTLGLNDGTNNFGLRNINNYCAGLKSIYGTSIGTSAPGTSDVVNNVSVGVTTDETKSGIISHRANENGKKYLYFYVGQFTQTATEQTAGLNAELFNGKADVDLSNINPSASAKEEITSWGMPDYTAGVTVTTPFTPTKDGVLVCIYSLTSYLGTVKISTGSTDLAAYKNQSSGSGGRISLSAIVCKNQQYTFDTASLSSAIFYPMKGE